MKLHLIGLPGSGKTTLAAELSSQLGVPHYDLDVVAYADERWTMRPERVREERVGQIRAEPGFVTEGHFLAWITPLLDAADGVVWVDPPLRVLMWRQVRRFGLRRPGWLLARLRFQVRCYRRPMGRGPVKDDPNLTRSGLEITLRRWEDKVVRLRRPLSAPEVIATVGRLQGGTT